MGLSLAVSALGLIYIQWSAPLAKIPKVDMQLVLLEIKKIQICNFKLAASRRATDPLLDPICDLAAQRGVPVLHHIWQHRRHDWPGQEASDGAELCALAWKIAYERWSDTANGDDFSETMKRVLRPHYSDPQPMHWAYGSQSASVQRRKRPRRPQH